MIISSDENQGYSTVVNQNSEGKMSGNGFLKSIFTLANSKADLLSVDNVLLNIRYSALSQNSRAERRMIVWVCLPALWVYELITIPLAVLTSFKELLISVSLALIPYLIIEIIDLNKFFMLSAIIFVLQNIKKITLRFSLLFFDATDIITCGALTELALKFYGSLSVEDQKSFITTRSNLFIQHFYVSRQSLDKPFEKAWESYFSEIAIQLASEPALLELEVEDYWH